MFYEEKNEKELREALFKNPGSSYRGAPFWAWNTRLDKNELIKQIHQFKEMGFGGFHIHCRVGLDTEYLGEEFFECVKACEEEAKKEGLYCFLYDEDRWPSGSAGGIVTRETNNRTRFLVFSPVGYVEDDEEAYMAAAKAVRSKNRKHLAYYRIHLDEEGYLEKYDFLTQKPQNTDDLWEAFLEVSGDTPWFNNQAYVNTLDKKAIRRFLDVTHERYYEEIGSDFGSNIKSIFTDEPQTTHKGMLTTPFDRVQVLTAYTDDFDETFRKKYGYSLIEHLPEIFYEQKTRDYQVRYHYHTHVMERFSEAFGDQIGEWCDAHQISLTGHMLNEWTLYSQTLAIGECMRPMKKFGIPGVDMLCDRREFSTLKQAASVARQENREGVMCEIYGVTGWAFDFRNHKLAGDWQAAMGVTFRVPHLTWVSMEGEAKRDYPACIGRHSPWYRRYGLIEDHFARLNTALTRGTPLVRVGIIHPIESYWMYWGNKAQTSLKRQVLEEGFEQLIEWMLFGLIDFDFISESLLSEEEGIIEKNNFSVGAMSYQTILVPECSTLRTTTLNRLEKFAEKGGRIIFLGEPPAFEEARISGRAQKLAERTEMIPFNRAKILETLANERDVDIDVFSVDGSDPTRMKHKEEGNRASNLIYQMRTDGENRWLFVSHVNKPFNENIAWTEQWKIKIRGIWNPVEYNTLTGEIRERYAFYQGNNTIIEQFSSQHDSLLLKLIPGKCKEIATREYLSLPQNTRLLPEPDSYLLLEDNCFMLDQAEYAFDNGQWSAKEEILRIDNLFRKVLGYPLRMEALAQPWVDKDEEKPRHTLKLRFSIRSELALQEVFLAMEHPEHAAILWNGKEIQYQDEGFYVDESIKKCRLPELKEGINELIVTIPFGRKTNVEWMYLLGAFGCRAEGREGIITALPERIVYGNIVEQNLAFYGGNLEYTTHVETAENGNLFLEISHYHGALMDIWLNGESKGALFMAPYRKNLGYVKKGRHEIRIRLYGNRINSFGAVHNANISEPWYGPNLWRTEGNKWSYEYQLFETGILVSPVWWIEKEPSL